jgi:hypothetical protein
MAMYRKSQMMEEVHVSTDASRQWELEPSKESMDGVRPSGQPKVTADVGKNQEIVWKVSERKPIHMCKRALNSMDEGCVFALCGDCFKPPNMCRCAGRKRTHQGMTVEKIGCHHEDLHTLLRFEAPSSFNDKFRTNPLKHFPTKCPVCWIGLRERLKHN